MAEIKMVIPSDFNFVPGVRICISRIAYNFGFNDRESYHIETIVDEICNNAIEHDGIGKDSNIILICKFQKGKMELIVKDGGGREFNVKEVFQRNIKLLQEQISKDTLMQPRRGRGLIIVQKLVDKLDIKVAKSGTTVRIVKKAGASK